MSGEDSQFAVLFTVRWFSQQFKQLGGEDTGDAGFLPEEEYG